MRFLNLLSDKTDQELQLFLESKESEVYPSLNDIKVLNVFFIKDKELIVNNFLLNDKEKVLLINILDININFLYENRIFYKIIRCSDFVLVASYENFNINTDELLQITESIPKETFYNNLYLNQELKTNKNYNNLLIDFIDKIEPKLKSVYYSYNVLKSIVLFNESVEDRLKYNNFIFENISGITNKNLENMSNLLYELRNYFNSEVQIFVQKIMEENTKKDFYEIMVLPSTTKKLSLSDDELILKELVSNINLLKIFIENTNIQNKKRRLKFTKLVEDVRHFFHQTVNIITMLSLKLLNKVIVKEQEKQQVLKDNDFFIELYESVIIRITKFEKQLQELKLISLNKEDITINLKLVTAMDIIKYFKLIDNKKEFIYKNKLNEIYVIFDVENYDLIFKIDYEKILEAIETLLQNAYEELSEKQLELDYTYEKLVKISITNDDNFIYISVIDNGRGISEENRQKIFEKYFTTGKTEGSGIGLAAVSRIMELLKGEVELKTKLGEGSEFILKIPRNIN